MKTTGRWTMVATLLAVVFWGCGDDDNGNPDGDDTTDALDTTDDAAPADDGAGDALEPVVVQVGLGGFRFDPATVTIAAGTTVRWERSSGTHTVTSGTGAADPQVGALFDAPIGAASPTFEFTFDTPGTYSYFCRPHESFGMIGSVEVTP